MEETARAGAFPVFAEQRIHSVPALRALRYWGFWFIKTQNFGFPRDSFNLILICCGCGIFAAARWNGMEALAYWKKEVMRLRLATSGEPSPCLQLEA